MSCYLRNGTKARRALPCNHTAITEGKHTACCDPDDQCLTNGFCRDPAANQMTNFVWFFGCTDMTFQDPACGNYCDKANREYQPVSRPKLERLRVEAGNNHLIFQCPETDTWCCNTGTPAPAEDRLSRPNLTCCNISDLVFKAPMPVIYATALPPGTPFPIATLLTRSLTLPTLSSTTSSRPLNGTNSAIASGTPSASASTIPDSGTPSLAIGLGTGLGGGAVIALGIGWFFLWRRRKRRDEIPVTETASDERTEVAGQDIAEKSGKERFEIQDKDPPTEVMGDMYRAELEAPARRENGA